MFLISNSIREEGRHRQRTEHLPHNPVTPVIEIAFTVITRDDELFRQKLLQLKPIYETCLKVKTGSTIRAEERSSRSSQKTKLSTRKTIFVCPHCQRQFTKEYAKQRKFCDADGMKIRTVFVFN
jgi:hypothetical protein